MAQLVEHILGKDEVPSSNLGSSSKKGCRNASLFWCRCYPYRFELLRICEQRKTPQCGVFLPRSPTKREQAEPRFTRRRVATRDSDRRASETSHRDVFLPRSPTKQGVYQANAWIGAGRRLQLPKRDAEIVPFFMHRF